MFPNVSKSKAKKEIQALRELTETEEDFHLLNISLKIICSVAGDTVIT